MKKLIGFALGSFFLVGLPVFALQPGDQVPAKDALAGDRSNTETQRHEVTGTIATLNPTTGGMTVHSPQGDVQVHILPKALTDLKTGDSVTVHYMLARTETAPGAARAYDAPAPQGLHHVTGLITAIDRDAGRIEVKTDDALLKLLFPSGELHDLQIGQRAVVEMGLKR